jgi:nucleotide-binding universal stress UspA family protein
MRETHLPSPSVVVGIDGSRAAVRAALWAVDEAVSRDIPLRLMCAVPAASAGKLDSQNETRKLATAEAAVRHASMVVEATDKPVKIEVNVVHGPPVRTLLDASRSAAVICVGAVGLAHSAPGGVGSTAAPLASSAHCAVAIIRGRDVLPAADRGAILAYLGSSPDDGVVLQASVEQARLRGVRLQVVTAWRSRFGDAHDGAVVAEANRDVHAQLDRRLEPWVQRHPDLEVNSVVLHGDLLDYLAKEAASIQLVVLGTHDHGFVELSGPTGTAVLQGTECSVLFVSRQHL